MEKKKLNARQTSDFCRNLSLLVQAGIGLGDGLFLMAEEHRQYDSGLLTLLGQQLDRGESLSSAMEGSGAFPAYAVGLVRVGEHTGRLENALFSLAEYYSDRCRIRRMMRNALGYPILIMALMLMVVAVLLVKVLPVFDRVYASMGTRLTGIGAGLLQLGQGLAALLPALLVVLAVLFPVVLAFCASARLRQRAAGVYRRLFGDRGTACCFNNAQFARALSMGLGSGLPPEEAFQLSSAILEEIPQAHKRCCLCRQMVEEGVSFAAALEQTGFLSAADSRLLAVGTRGGNADRVMKEIADRLMEQATADLESRALKVEPAIVLLASLLVGAILLSVMLPLANIMSVIG